MNFEDLIDKLKSKPLSGDDILQSLNGKTKIYKYSDLSKFSSIDELLHPYNNAVILYETKPNYGHWICVLKRNDNVIEYYDPYGKPIDYPLKYINASFKKETNQDDIYLLKLMLKSPYDIEYNNVAIQKLDRDISSCGRHCIMRIVCKDLNLKQYQKLFKKEGNLDGDDKVTLLTGYI